MNKLINLRILSSLILKRRMAPFHFWFPNIIEGLTWSNCLIIIIWQKIAPLILISYLILNYSLITIFLSILIGTLGGLNQISLRKIIAYSSINHLRWILIAIYLNNVIWLNYFLFYWFLLIPLIYYFNINKLFYFNQLYSIIYNTKLKIILFINFLSLGGLPPFLGFLPKWLVIQSLSENHQMFIITITVTLTLITLFYYIRISYAGLILNYYNPIWKIKIIIKSNNIFIYLIISFISIFGLLITNIIFILL